MGDIFWYWGDPFKPSKELIELIKETEELYKELLDDEVSDED